MGKIIKKSIIVLMVLFVILGGGVYFLYAATETKEEKIEVIYSTDLWVNGDLDDKFDLLAMYSLEKINLHIILDNATEGDVQNTEMSGKNSIHNLNKLTGRNLNPLIGKKHRFADHIEEQVTNDILNLLGSVDKCIIITVGSLRDIAAAYEKDPQLFISKVDSLYIFAGSYEQTYVEWNVALDKEAYDFLMKSSLPIYWIPCFQNNLWTSGNHSSYLQIKHEDILTDCNESLLKWIIYEWKHDGSNFERYVVTDDVLEEFMQEPRNLWCTHILPLVTYKGETLNGDSPFKSYRMNNGKSISVPWHFEDTFYGGHEIKTFTVHDEDDFFIFSVQLINTSLKNLTFSC